MIFEYANEQQNVEAETFLRCWNIIGGFFILDFVYVPVKKCAVEIITLKQLINNDEIDVSVE